MKFIRRFLSVKYVFFSILILVSSAGYFLIKQLPDIYESTARLAIESADENIFGETSRNSNTLSQRAHLVISRVLRNDNALRILQEQGVLAADSTEEEQSEAIDRFLGNASIDFDNVSVINRYTGKQGLFSLGLVVAFRDENPELAYEFTSSLVEDVSSGVRMIADPSANQTQEFLTRELENSSQKLAEIGGQVAEFKNQNALYLPELHTVTVRQLDELVGQIQRSREDLADLRRGRAANDIDLAVTSPDALLFSTDGTRIESPAERLEQLRIDRAFAASRYSAVHPQVINLDREIEALEQHAGSTDTRRLEVEMRQAEARLAAQRERYSDEHPDVVSALREVARMRSALDSATLNAAPRQTSEPSNPAYNRMLARRDSLNEEAARETRRLAQLEARHAEVQSQLAKMPQVEKEMIELERLQAREKQGYDELERQLTSAKLSSSMRSADLLERFVVIEPPVQPIHPVAPRRGILLGLLGLLALCAASVGALLRFRIRDMIWDQHELAKLVDNRIVMVPRSV